MCKQYLRYVCLCEQIDFRATLNKKAKEEAKMGQFMVEGVHKIDPDK